MNEETDNGAAAAAGDEQRQVQIRKLYLKDVSFESPAAPGVFTGAANFQPQVDLQLNTESQRLEDGLYEITLVVTVTGTESERTVFLIEIKQSGLFAIQGFGQQETHHLIGAYCPSILFPYAREAIADLVQKGGLPQLVLQPVNFDALYAQHLRRQQEGAAAPDASA